MTNVNYQRTAIHSSDDIRAIADHAGSHFFDDDTMRFFNSRVLSDVWAPDGHETEPGRRYVFVTSEKYEDEPRFYQVRMMTLESVRDDRPDTDFHTIAGAFPSATEAKRAAKAFSDHLDALNRDVWLRFIDEEDEDEEAEAEANTYFDGYRYRVEWCLTAVGLITRVYFDTHEQSREWLTREGFQDFSS